MLPLTVVKYFNVFEDALSGLFSRTIVLIINQFGFQGFEKGFCDIDAKQYLQISSYYNESNGGYVFSWPYDYNVITGVFHPILNTVMMQPALSSHHQPRLLTYPKACIPMTRSNVKMGLQA